MQSCKTSGESRVLTDNRVSSLSFTHSKFLPTARLGELFTRSRLECLRELQNIQGVVPCYLHLAITTKASGIASAV